MDFKDIFGAFSFVLCAIHDKIQRKNLFYWFWKFKTKYLNLLKHFRSFFSFFSNISNYYIIFLIRRGKAQKCFTYKQKCISRFISAPTRKYVNCQIVDLSIQLSETPYRLAEIDWSARKRGRTFHRNHSQRERVQVTSRVRSRLQLSASQLARRTHSAQFGNAVFFRYKGTGLDLYVK